MKVINEALSILDGETNLVKTKEPPEISSSQAGPGTLTSTSHRHPNIATQSPMSGAGDLSRTCEIPQGLDGPSRLGPSDASAWLYDQRAGHACSAESDAHNQVISANLLSAASSMAELVAAPAQPPAQQIQHYDANVRMVDPVLWDFQGDLYSQPDTDPNTCGSMAGPFGTSMFIDNVDNVNLFDLDVGGASSEEPDLSFQLSFADPALEDAWRSIMENQQLVPAESNPIFSFTP